MTALDERLAQVAEVLMKHEYDTAFRNGLPVPACECGWVCETAWTTTDVHEAHVAQALAPLLAQWQAEDKAEAEAERDELKTLIGSHAGEAAKWRVWRRQDARRLEQARARAEAAEQQLADLRAGIEALIEDYSHPDCWDELRGVARRDLRALLAGETQ